MKIIVGLGNPGEKYKSTRHNAGRETIQSFQKKESFPDFEFKKKLQALISKKNNVILAMPETFMNASGRAVKSILKQYKAKAGNLTVVHDDYDLYAGKMKISKDRGSGGHKGIESIIKELKTRNFTRIRIGIKPKREYKELEKFVLKKFTPSEKPKIKKIMKKSLEAISMIIEKGTEKAMNEFNKE